MKKVVIVAVAIILAVMLMNTALGKYVNSSSNTVTAGSSSIDVKIVERTHDCNYYSHEHTNEIVDAVSSIEETLNNLAPGDKIVSEYKIINIGCVDVLLDGVNVSVDNQSLKNYLTLKWNITQYKDNQPVKTVTNCANGQSLSKASAVVDVSSEQITLGCDDTDKDYCVLELEIVFDENSPLFDESLETVFTITPSFIQN